MKFSIKDLFSKYTVTVTFIEEIFDVKIHFLCSDSHEKYKMFLQHHLLKLKLLLLLSNLNYYLFYNII